VNAIESDLLGAASLEQAAKRYRTPRMRAAYLAAAKFLRNRAAIAMEARKGTDPKGLDGEAATARAGGIAQAPERDR
jgi:hypothetical protein